MIPPSSQVLKAMIDEKFKQVEGLCQNQGPESELHARIARLEDENRGLQEYAAKLEKAVKLLLNNQRSKKEKQNKSVQTDEMVSIYSSTPKCIFTFNVFVYFWHEIVAAKRTHSSVELQELSVFVQIWHKVVSFTLECVRLEVKFSC
jgi:hypothetical protein